MKPQRLCFSAVIALAMVPAAGDDAVDQDWPCEQALVPEVSAAVVWDGPSVEGLSDQWKSVTEVAQLVNRLTSRRADPAQTSAQIESFAAAQAPGERDRQLTLLFAGALEVLNADRHQLNDGILRYSRDQQRRAEALDVHLTEMVQLDSDGSVAASQRLTDLNKRIELEQRVFDDREKSIPFLCTRPRVVEQRIGELAREIAAQME